METIFSVLEEIKKQTFDAQLLQRQEEAINKGHQAPIPEGVNIEIAVDPSDPNKHTRIGNIKGIEKVPSHLTIAGTHIGALAMLGNGVRLGYGVDIGRESRIDSNATVEHETTVGERVHIGKGARIHHAVELKNDASVGESVLVLHETSIGERANIGDKSKISHNVKIGDDSTTGNDVAIKANTSIGKDTFIDDRTTLGEHVVIGSKTDLGQDSILADHVKVGDEGQFGDMVKIDEKTEIGNKANFGSDIHVGREVILQQNVAVEDRSVIGNESKIESGVLIHVGARVGRNSRIGANTSLQDTVLKENSQVGTDSRIASATVGPNVKIGHSVVVRNAQLDGVNERVIKQRAKKTEFQRASDSQTSIGSGARVIGTAGDNRVGLSESVTVGPNAIVRHDLAARSFIEAGLKTASSERTPPQGSNKVAKKLRKLDEWAITKVFGGRKRIIPDTQVVTRDPGTKTSRLIGKKLGVGPQAPRPPKTR